MSLISLVLYGIICILSACLIVSIIQKHDDKPAFSYLWFLWMAFVAVVGYAFSELPLRRDKVECGVFSFKIHKKYSKPIPGYVINYTYGDDDSGVADFFSDPPGTYFEYQKVPDCGKWRLERMAKHYTDEATKKNKAGFQNWYISDGPFDYDVAIITDYHQSKHRNKRERRRDVVFFEETETGYYLCCLRLCRPTKFTLNRSHEIFFKNLRINGKKPVHPRKR